MIITKKWLNEWIDVLEVSTQRLCEIFNSIGLEVDSVTKVRIPSSVVVGYIKDKQPHQDADKLSVCKVDVGSEELQIVCGAKNVDKGQFVAVAKIGTILPNGLEIKPTNIRGVESNGMICSSSELGLESLNDGILILDNSIGKLTQGLELNLFLDDDIIDVELTANRGDCLSIYGIARDLRVVLDKDIKVISNVQEDENVLGIGRILSVQVEDEIDSKLIYKALEFTKTNENVLMQLRLKMVGLDFENGLDCIIKYATYSTGVLFRIYNIEEFKKDEKSTIYVKKSPEGFVGIYGDELVSYVGYSQQKSCDISKAPRMVVLEASYIKPEVISKVGMEHKDLKSDFQYYRSSRGSEPDLEFGLQYLDALFFKEEGIKSYGGMQIVDYQEQDKIISFEIDKAMGIIGQNIPKNEVVNILKGLGFGVIVRSEQEVININVPNYRHDIHDTQDICEEIVRIVGIDNIKSKPYYFAETLRQNRAYKNFKKRYDLRYKSVGVGFFETLHYVFDDKNKMEALGLRTLYKKRDIANPITKELNTLRTTLALHLIEAVSNNIKNSKPSVALFEIGKVFNYKRDEITKIGWIFSGPVSRQSVENNGKPKDIDFATFASKIRQIIGKFELEQDSPNNKLYSPYEYANVIVNGEKIGFMGRVHIKVEDENKIPQTYFCEIDFDKISANKRAVKPYSKFPISSRELSLLIPKQMPYGSIKKCINSLKIEHLIKFYPIDLFESKDLGKNSSLSVKFIFQDKNATLSDEKISDSIDIILKNLHEQLDINLR